MKCLKQEAGMQLSQANLYNEDVATKLNLFYFMTQSVPCCKQAVTVTKTNQLMLYRPKSLSVFRYICNINVLLAEHVIF
jgi:hypothetical protein